jgi:hypothetical protein
MAMSDALMRELTELFTVVLQLEDDSGHVSSMAGGDVADFLDALSRREPGLAVAVSDVMGYPTARQGSLPHVTAEVVMRLAGVVEVLCPTDGVHMQTVRRLLDERDIAESGTMFRMRDVVLSALSPDERERLLGERLPNAPVTRSVEPSGPH